ncbi:MAG: hypothetical protein ABII79_12275 [bacterium]
MKVQWDNLGRKALLLLLPLIVGCHSSGSDQSTAQQLSFDVVDSLLGPICEVATARKSFHPPVDFVPIPDSLFEILHTRFTQEVSPEGMIEFIRFFFDEQHSSGLIVSTVDGLNLTADTSIFIDKYRQAVLAEYGNDNVRVGDYWVDSIYVKNFIITDSVHVRFQLLCLSSEGDALELQYVVPRAVYATMIKSLESSIGTLKPLHQGG